jgi:propionate CoA-transferase
MIELVNDEECEAYNFPQGSLLQWLRAMACGLPGLMTPVGLRTFVDPRVEGGRLNAVTTEDMVEIIELKGEEYLFYPALPIDVGIIRGTTADEKGNITFEHEAHHNESLVIAQAAKHFGGIVIAQVERIARYGTLDPRAVAVPGINVDVVVVAEPANHMQANTVMFDPAICGETKKPPDAIKALSLSERKVIARRAAMELRPDDVVNLGIGMPADVAKIAVEEDVLDAINITVESGGIGGVPLGGIDFGSVVNPDALLPHISQFDFYDGGGIDVTFLGLAQADSAGNVNVSKFNGRIAGCGGFVDITQNAKEIVFMGTLTAGGIETEISPGRIAIKKEGAHRKFIQNVEQITFSGTFARDHRQHVLYITERAVFRLEEEGITLVEVAPGFDIEKEVFAHMDFRVKISNRLKDMDARLFNTDIMNITSEIKAKERRRT